MRPSILSKTRLLELVRNHGTAISAGAALALSAYNYIHDVVKAHDLVVAVTSSGSEPLTEPFRLTLINTGKSNEIIIGTGTLLIDEQFIDGVKRSDICRWGTDNIDPVNIPPGGHWTAKFEDLEARLRDLQRPRGKRQPIPSGVRGRFGILITYIDASGEKATKAILLGTVFFKGLPPLEIDQLSFDEHREVKRIVSLNIEPILEKLRIVQPIPGSADDPCDKRI